MTRITVTYEAGGTTYQGYFDEPIDQDVCAWCSLLKSDIAWILVDMRGGKKTFARPCDVISFSLEPLDHAQVEEGSDE
jgi:hypothetical protein